MQRVLTKTEAAKYLGLSLDAFGQNCNVKPLPFKKVKGERYDAGDKLEYIKATIRLASKRDDLGPDRRGVLVVAALVQQGSARVGVERSGGQRADPDHCAVVEGDRPGVEVAHARVGVRGVLPADLGVASVAPVTGGVKVIE